MRKSKFFSIFVAVIMALGIVACDNSVECLKINNEVPPSIEVNDACEIRNAIRAVITGLRTQEHVSFSDVEMLVYQKFSTIEVERAFYQRFGMIEADRAIALRSSGDMTELTISDAAFSVVDEFATLESLNFLTKNEYLSALDGVLANSRNALTEFEYNILSISLLINADMLDVLSDELEPITPDGFGRWWNTWGRCVGVVVSGIGNGALNGAAAGAVIGGLISFKAGGTGAIPGAIGGGIAGGIFGGIYEFSANDLCHSEQNIVDPIIPEEA